MAQMKLKEIFWNLEKGSTKWSGYFDVYEKHLNKFVDKSPRILEIGVLGGGSIEMWLKYFGKDTSVIAVDVNPECLNYKYDGDVQIVLGDQSSPEFWKQFAEEYGNFDIIIDDGWHWDEAQLKTLTNFFPYLNDGGIYVIEDIYPGSNVTKDPTLVRNIINDNAHFFVGLKNNQCVIHKKALNSNGFC